MKSFLFILSVCGHYSQTVVAVNVIKNPSFEHDLAYWVCKHRPGLWNVENAPTGIVSSDTERRYSGKRALLLKGTPSGWGSRALYAQQYVSGKRIVKESSNASGIKFSWAYQLLSDSDKEISMKCRPQILLDIRFSDGRYLNVKYDLSVEMTAEFEFMCRTVPVYEVVDGLMVTLVIENDCGGTLLYIDDVSVEFTAGTEEYDLEECLLDTENLPAERLHVPFFLTSKYTRSHRNNKDVAVTIATQLTLDRLSNLNRLISSWQGPISVAILLFRQGNGQTKTHDRQAVTDILTSYYSSSLMQRYIDIHIVFEDPLNNEDSIRYPVNFLRNVAIKHVKTSHVYYLDADIMPSLSAKNLGGHLVKSLKDLQETGDISDTRKSAFATPIFTTKETIESLPDKKDLIEELKQGRDRSRFEVFNVVSHTPVNYYKWFTADKSYHIQYRENMEPYFVVPFDAPLMNDLFTGYGRDKCAYSRELNSAGYDFFVFHGAYGVNVAEKTGQPSILRRDPGIQVRLRVFLNMYFHEREMEGRYRDDVVEDDEDEDTVTDGDIHDEISSPQSSSLEQVDKDGTGSDNLVDGDDVQATENEVGMLPSYGLKCSTEFRHGRTLQLPGPPEDGTFRQMHHEHAIIESIAKEFGLQLMVQLESTNSMKGAVLLALMHWDSVVSLKPGEYVEFERVQNGVMEKLSGGSLREQLADIQRRNRRTLYWVRYTDKLAGYDTPIDIIKAFIDIAKQDDVISIFQLPQELHSVLYETVCGIDADWSLHVRNDAVVVRADSPVPTLHVRLPPIPDAATSTNEPQCDDTSVVTDVVLFSRDRPVQTLAFLESLATMATGINKVWLLYRFDDTVFQDGYKKVVSCMRNDQFAVELVREESEGFGYYLKDILSRRSTARYIIIAVDEIIWLHSFNVTQIACLMTHAGDSISMAQLRLGKELSAGKHLDKTKIEQQTRPVRSTSEWLLYYPYRLPYDFGYVTNVDGVMISREDFLAELRDSIDFFRNPSGLETQWVWFGLHQHVRHWHLMPVHSKLVNNPLEDGRILHLDKPGEKSYTLVHRFLNDDLKVDVKRFLESSRRRTHTHEFFDIHYIKANCIA